MEYGIKESDTGRELWTGSVHACERAHAVSVVGVFCDPKGSLASETRSNLVKSPPLRGWLDFYLPQVKSTEPIRSPGTRFSLTTSGLCKLTLTRYGHSERLPSWWDYHFLGCGACPSEGPALGCSLPLLQGLFFSIAHLHRIF